MSGMGQRTVLPPSEHWRAGMALLAKGDYELGFRLYETRPVHMGGRPEGRPTLSFPEWDGSPIRSLLILPEQGLGDQIMFARYAPWLEAQGITVFLLCHPSLARLFGSAGLQVIPASGRTPLPRADAWVLGPSLPYRCRTTPETIPPATYLNAAAQPTQHRIGLALRGNPANLNDKLRSLSPDQIARLETLPGALDLSPSNTGARDFQDTAEIVAGLDLVIAVDTSVAHLAGAMGKPCWVLLPREGLDWRWGDGVRSPWYPEMRLIRQERGGDWDAVLDVVSQDLGLGEQRD